MVTALRMVISTYKIDLLTLPTPCKKNTEKRGKKENREEKKTGKKRKKRGIKEKKARK